MKNKALNKGILFVCALEQETQNQLDDYDVLYTGVGKVNATYALTTHFGKYGSHIPYDLIINYGTAGSRKHSIGELVDCTKFIQRDMDVSGLGFMKSQTPFEPLVPIILDSSHVTFNPIGMNEMCATGDSFVQEETDYVVDMEAYALAKVCKLENVNFRCFKFISDNADESASVDWIENCKKGTKLFEQKLKDLSLI